MDTDAPMRVTKTKKPSSQPAASSVEQTMVRDRFTLPKADHARLRSLKERAKRLQNPVKKSELLWAGIDCLMAMKDKAFLSALNAVSTGETRRSSRRSKVTDGIEPKQD